jgi:hypothetical protein
MKICYLDFDGVLHDDAVYYSAERGIYVATPGRILFEWMPILEELLAPYPLVKLVLSTTWVRQRSLEFAKGKLSPALQARVIGATFDIRETQKLEFDLMSRGAQVLADVERRLPASWFAIDNDSAGWPAAARPRLVLTDDRLGLSEERVQAAIKAILTT